MISLGATVYSFCPSMKLTSSLSSPSNGALYSERSFACWRFRLFFLVSISWIIRSPWMIFSSKVLAKANFFSARLSFSCASASAFWSMSPICPPNNSMEYSLVAGFSSMSLRIFTFLLASCRSSLA